MKPTVVILLSDKRSGSTFLERELCSSSSIQHVTYTPHTFNETHYWVMAACLLRRPSRLFSNCELPKSYGGDKRVRRTLEKTILTNVPGFLPPDDDRELVFKGWEAVCTHYAKPVFFEKSPQHPHHWAALELMLEWMQSTHLDVKFIGLIRHPLAVLYSAKQLFHSTPADRQYPWLEGNHNILLMERFVGSDRLIIVKYEDLVSSPRSSFAKILRFIGLEDDPALGQSARKSSLLGWKQDPEFQVALDYSVIRLAQYFGYSDFECSGVEGSASTSSLGMFSDLGVYLEKVRSRLYYFYNRTFR